MLLESMWRSEARACMMKILLTVLKTLAFFPTGKGDMSESFLIMGMTPSDLQFIQITLIKVWKNDWRTVLYQNAKNKIIIDDLGLLSYIPITKTSKRPQNGL